ncbi:MAG: glutathione S-transferase family protein [Alphaproteobacteria bacterium]
MKLYNGIGAPNPRKVRIFIAEKGIDVPRVDLDLQAGAARTPDFLAKNALGGTPIIELDDGTVITESVAICRYLEDLHPTPPLFGSDVVSRAKVEMWNRRMEIEVMNVCGAIALHTFEFFKTRLTQIPAVAEASKARMPQVWAWLDKELSDGRPYLAGDSFSMADITGMCTTKLAEFTGTPVPDDLSHVSAWNARLRDRPSWEA